MFISMSLEKNDAAMATQTKRIYYPPLSPTNRTAQNWSTSGVGGEREVDVHDGVDARVEEYGHLIFSA